MYSSLDAATREQQDRAEHYHRVAASHERALAPRGGVAPLQALRQTERPVCMGARLSRYKGMVGFFFFSKGKDSDSGCATRRRPAQSRRTWQRASPCSGRAPAENVWSPSFTLFVLFFLSSRGRCVWGRLGGDGCGEGIERRDRERRRDVVAETTQRLRARRKKKTRGFFVQGVVRVGANSLLVNTLSCSESHFLRLQNNCS